MASALTAGSATTTAAASTTATSAAAAARNQAAQNQAAAVEAMYSATFVEDYLDCVENLPNDLQRCLSRLRDFDLTQYGEFLRDLDSLVIAFEKEKTAAGQRQVLAKIQLGLIAAQGIGDEKLATVQSMSDLIESKARQLEHGAKNLEIDKDNEDERQTPGPQAKPLAAPSKIPAKKVSEDKPDKQPAAKRRKKKEQDKHKDRDTEDETCSIYSNKSNSNNNNNQGNRSSSQNRGGGSGAGSGGGSGGGGGGGGSGVKKNNKRRSASKRQQSQPDSDHELDPSVEIDPDEPTYCLCDQVSYGEMIGCDNDLCPIEWFHFNCVQLTTKPKGKWYCPRCRDNKSTVMKSKAAFLKELVKYNKEKEEKNMKQNN